MLRFSSLNEDYKPILDKTCGIIFFSTPHRGSDVMNYFGTFSTIVLRGTTTVEELKPQSILLNKLNEEFPKIAPHVKTLSVGENESTCIGIGLCFQVKNFFLVFLINIYFCRLYQNILLIQNLKEKTTNLLN